MVCSGMLWCAGKVGSCMFECGVSCDVRCVLARYVQVKCLCSGMVCSDEMCSAAVLVCDLVCSGMVCFGVVCSVEVCSAAVLVCDLVCSGMVWCVLMRCVLLLC